MKKTTIHNLCALALAALCALPAVAQLNGTRYYRIRNAAQTSDYISLANDKFSYQTCVTAAGSATAAHNNPAPVLSCASAYLQTDIHMINDADCVNPASVIYAEQRKYYNNQFNLIAQGTSLLTLTTGRYQGSILGANFKDIYVNVTDVGGGLYTAHLVLETTGFSLGNRYLMDDNGTLVISESNSDLSAKWYLEPLDHFNVQPEVELNGKWYTTLYVPFDFELSGQVQKAYIITNVTDQTLEYSEVASNGTVPACTPVILECGSPNAADCRLIPKNVPTYTSPVSTAQTAPVATEKFLPSNNTLRGTYYCNTDGYITYQKSSGTGSINADHFTDTSGKYVIGKTADGKLGFIAATGTAMPANKAWLTSAGVFPSVWAPTLSLDAGTYASAQTVTISAQEGATILYSTDGGTTWQEYNGNAIEVGEGTTTLQAKAIKAGLWNDSETVSATYVVEIANPVLSMTPESMTISDAAAGVFTITGTDIQGSINVGLASNSDWYLNPETLSNTGGEVNVTYTGRALTAQNTVNAYAANNAEVTASATVNYKADIYVVTDNGVKDNWNFNNGSMMTEEDGIYTATFTATVPNTFILFARKLGDGVDWNTRYVFGPNSDGDWWMPADVAEQGGTIDVDDDDPVKLPYAGEYTITINANDYTFKIERLADPVLRGDVNSDGEVDIRDVTALIDYLLDETTVINQANADVDDKQGISITDVTALIDILLDN